MSQKNVESCFQKLMCIACIKKPAKKNNKGLVTFDKRQYFPMSFVEKIGDSNAIDKEDKSDKSGKKHNKKGDKHKKHVV